MNCHQYVSSFSHGFVRRVCVTAPAPAHFLQEPARASELYWQSLPFSPRDTPSLSRTFGSCFRRLRGRQLECIHRSTAIISNVAARPCHWAGLQRHRCDKELSFTSTGDTEENGCRWLYPDSAADRGSSECRRPRYAKRSHYQQDILTTQLPPLSDVKGIVANIAALDAAWICSHARQVEL